MEKEFWLARWERREIGFHRPDIHWALNRHWDEICGGGAGRVLVPLCGKSLDQRWLARRVHEVVGIEFSEQAIREFYQEWNKAPAREQVGKLHRWQAENVVIFEGDFFDFRTSQPFELFYDRAALVALPRKLRSAYLDHLHRLLADDARGLLVTFEYDQARMDGPPFSVPETEMMAESGFRFELLERREVLQQHPGFAQRGLSALDECAWLVAPA